MPNFRRANVPGGTFFFMLVTHRRRKLFHLEKNRALLGDAIRQCKQQWPFAINAIVLLPDHLHTIWSLPAGDNNFPGRWNFIKRSFTTHFLKAGGSSPQVSAGKERERRGVWQRRYWEHAIENEEDFAAHFDYIHYNPVKHQLVQCPREWKPSSFHRWVNAGVYPDGWGRGSIPGSLLRKSDADFGEPS